MTKDLINSFNDLIDNLEKLGEYIEAIETMPPRENITRAVVEEAVNNCIETIHSKLDSIHSLFNNKIQEEK